MLKITNEIILTAGPSITHKEIEYVTDAVINGWNHHMSDYLNKFEQKFAEYIGVKYAFTTSSCTGAMHLAMLGMGIKPGDEVIVPETTWIATAAAPVYVGATPVFADIDPDTWVLDSEKVEKLITKKTKAIMPVHLYGNPVNMEPLWKLADKYNLIIFEDAAPSIGAEYHGKKTGNLGNAAAFSFQGAKALATGEGGMFVTNDRKLYERTKFIGDAGRDPNRPLAAIEIGYKYKMSNLQAAMGLAQLERVEEIVAKKRQIFKWYYERLSDIDIIKMNAEKPGTRNLYWMSSLILDKKAPVSRDDFMKKLRERNIDCRVIFYPISSFPMFKGVVVDNPVAYDVPLRGVNLPSGHDRTEEEIDYICAHIRDILDVKTPGKVSMNQPTGWLAFRDETNAKLKEYKFAKEVDIEKYCLPLKKGQKTTGRLRPITADVINKEKEIKLLAEWRKKVLFWWPANFKVTYEGTKKWAQNTLINTPDRILFFVEDEKNNPIGHVGLYRFNYKEKFCEIDNIIRGKEKVFKGAMTLACTVLLDWVFKTLKIKTAYLRVVAENSRAIQLYERLGFKEIHRDPIMNIAETDQTRWIDIIGNPYLEVKRYYVTMKLTRGEWAGKRGK